MVVIGRRWKPAAVAAMAVHQTLTRKKTYEGDKGHGLTSPEVSQPKEPSLVVHCRRKHLMLVSPTPPVISIREHLIPSMPHSVSRL